MEVVGTVASAVTLAALFKLCIEAFDAIRTANRQALDLKKLNLKLQIEKCRLYTWGETMGLTLREEDNDEAAKPIDACPYPGLVQETLSLILDIFRDSQKLKEKYGCVSQESEGVISSEPERALNSVISQLNAPFNNFKVRSLKGLKGPSIAKKAFWVINDCKKFESLISEAKSFVDGLQDITKDIRSAAAQQDTMSSRIRSISDVRTLDWVSEVCEVDYPTLSDAASLRADTISDFSHFHRDIQNWKDAVSKDEDDSSDASSVETAIAGLENLTVTELKHKLSTFLLEARISRLQAKEPDLGLEYPEQYVDPRSNALLHQKFGPKSPNPNPDPRKDTLIDIMHSVRGDDNEADIDEFILEKMYEATHSEDFKVEQQAIIEWFKVLSLAEAATAFYNLGEAISKEPHLARFFSEIQAYRERSVNDTKTRYSQNDFKSRLTRSSLNDSEQTNEANVSPLPPLPESETPLLVKQVRSSWPVAAVSQNLISESLDGLFPSYSDFVLSQKGALSKTVPAQRQTEERAKRDFKMSLHEKQSKQFDDEAKPKLGPSRLQTASSETLRQR